jgi:hypothetical protein
VKRRRRFAAALAVGLAALCRPAAGADAPRVQVELAPEVVGLDELATLSVEVATSGFGLVDFEPRFRLENLEIASGPSTTQSQRWVNGETSASTRLVWRLRPLQLGRAAVRGLAVTLGGRAVALPDREVEVVAAAPPGRRAPAAAPVDPLSALFGDDDPLGFARRPAAPAAAPKLRLATEVDRTVAYPGEQVGWRLVLDTQTDISAFNPRDLPDFQGFWVREVALPDQLKPEWVEVAGERFGRVTMLRRALFPLRPGRYSLGPASADVVARIAEASWFGPLGRNQQVTVRAEPLEVEVRPLPPPPADFSGVVGDLSLAAALDHRRLEVGQAATLAIVASGPGNLEGLSPPDLDLPSGLRAFEPRPETTSTVAGGRLLTTVKWSYVVTAERSGSYAIPAVRLVWFDPAAAAYRTAASAEVRLEVVAPTRVARTPPAGSAAEAPAGTSRAAGVSSRGRTVAGAVALGVALLAGAVLAGRALRARSPQHETRRRLASRLAAARAEPSPRLAAAALEEAWRAWAGERWGLGAGLPVARWGEALGRAGVPETLAAELVALLDELHYLRYAPELSDVETLREEAFERSRRLLRDLR